MKILISGASGLIGSALREFWAKAGHETVCLVRSRPIEGEIHWDPAAQRLDPAPLEGFDAVVHLAGESIATGRWTAAKMARIRDSRVGGTRLLSRTLAGLGKPPKVFASASAVGFYGDRGEEAVDEDSPPGAGFMADVCRQWEAAAQPAAEAGIRAVQLRFGLVLAPGGGALGKMLPAFKLGLGGRLGNGRQYMSWITLDDVVAAVDHVLTTAAIAGPVNLVAPRPATNRDFTAALGRVLRRPTWLPVPAWALRMLLGPMADELLLGGAKVLPQRLLDSGYEFRDPDLAAALGQVLKR